VAVGKSTEKADQNFQAGLGLEWARNPILKNYPCTLMSINYDFWVTQRTVRDLRNTMGKQLFEGDQIGYMKTSKLLSFAVETAQKEYAQYFNEASQKVLKNGEVGIVLMPDFLVNRPANSNALALTAALNEILQGNAVTPEWQALTESDRFQLIKELSNKATDEKMNHYFQSRIKDNVPQNPNIRATYMMFWLKNLDPNYSAKIWKYVNPILKKAPVKSI
jgi:hypothetical protein